MSSSLLSCHLLCVMWMMEQLVIKRQFLCVPVTMIFGNQFVELIPWYVIHYLGENIATEFLTMQF